MTFSMDPIVFVFLGIVCLATAVLFVAVNLARLTKVDYSSALRQANAKFERRFRRMEALAADENTALAGKTLAEQDAYWERAKAEDKAGRLRP